MFAPKRKINIFLFVAFKSVCLYCSSCCFAYCCLRIVLRVFFIMFSVCRCMSLQRETVAHLDNDNNNVNNNNNHDMIKYPASPHRVRRVGMFIFSYLFDVDITT
jgi:hypothetical protein